MGIMASGQQGCAMTGGSASTCGAKGSRSMLGAFAPIEYTEKEKYNRYHLFNRSLGVQNPVHSSTAMHRCIAKKGKLKHFCL